MKYLVICLVAISAGWLFAFSASTVRVLTHKTERWTRRAWIGVQGLLVFMGAVNGYMLISLLNPTASTLASLFAIASAFVGMAIAIFSQRETEWYYRYKDRQCGDKTVPEDIKMES